VAAGAGGLTPDEIILERSKDILEQLPETLDKANGLAEIFKMNAHGILPSLTTVLIQEIEKFNRLLVAMRKSLVDLDLAIRGFIVMSSVLDSMYTAMTNNMVP